MNKGKSSSFADYIMVIIKWRRFIIKTFIITVVAAIIISLVIPPKYTATATILPPNSQQEAMLGLMTANIAGLQNLSRLGNILPGATTPSDLFAAILQSSTIMGKIIQKYNLMKIFKTKTADDAHKNLNKITKILVSTEGIVSVSVTWHDKKLATNIANSYIEELDKFNTETAMTVGKRYRMFIEQRLKETEDTLKKAEEALRQFQEQNRTVALDVEIQAAIEAIAQIKSQIIVSEVQKGTWTSIGESSNPYLRNVERELDELKKQLAKIEYGDKARNQKEFGAGFSVPLTRLPQVILEYARLFRDVKIQEAIFELLTEQYEQAKIMELKDTPTVQILDKARPLERRSSPNRSRIVILASMLSVIFCLITSFFLESIEQLKKKPEEYNKWATIYKELKDSSVRVKKWLFRPLKK